MTHRKTHPNKEIEAAIKLAEKQGWRCRKSGTCGHGWGRLLCSSKTRIGCSVAIWSTPNDPNEHAKHIRGKINSCRHKNAV
jgi:hypothetical protein